MPNTQSDILSTHIKMFWAEMRQKADNTTSNATNSPTCPIIIVYAHRKVSFCVSFRHFTGTIIIIIHMKAEARERRIDVVTMVNYVLNTKHSQRLFNCCFCCHFCFYIFWRVYVFYADFWLFANKNKDRTPNFWQMGYRFNNGANIARSKYICVKIYTKQLYTCVNT